MSQPSQSLEHLPPPPAQAEEGIRWFAVIGVGIGSLLVFTIATFVAYRYMNLREKELQPLGPDPVPAIWANRRSASSIRCPST